MTVVLSREDVEALLLKSPASTAAVLQDAMNGTKPKGRHKYRATPQTVDGTRFDSTGESERYGELTMMQRAGLIAELELQPSFDLHVCRLDTGELVKIGRYVGDFRYRDVGTKMTIIEDYKGPIRTPMYRWKKRHVEAEYGVYITEVTHA